MVPAGEELMGHHTSSGKVGVSYLYLVDRPIKKRNYTVANYKYKKVKSLIPLSIQSAD